MHMATAVTTIQQDGRQLRKQAARAYASFFIYDYVRAESDPAWEDLTASQQQAFRMAFQIGAASVNLVKVLGR